MKGTRILRTIWRLVKEGFIMLPIVRIDQVEEELGVSRRWMNQNWFSSDNPPPHFVDGDSVFFELEELKRWAKRRIYESGFTDTPTEDQSD